jgi:hypothetical protein
VSFRGPVVLLGACALACSSAKSSNDVVSADVESRESGADEPDANDASSDLAGDPNSDGDAPGVLLVHPAQFTEEGAPMRMLADDGALELWAAPQGGHVVLIGAKVQKLPGDVAILRVRVRHPATNLIIAEEARSVKMVPVPGEPDMMQPDIRTRSQVAHVPLCPDYDAFDIVDRPMSVTVQVMAPPVDPTHVGETTLTLLPTCVAAASEEHCRCECTANYVLGKCPKNRDASVD